MSNDLRQHKLVGARHIHGAASAVWWCAMGCFGILLAAGPKEFCSAVKPETEAGAARQTASSTGAPLSKIQSASRDQRLEKLRIKTIIAAEDPLVDGWDSEALSTEVNTQLKQLGKLLAEPDALDAAHLAELAATNCRSATLRPGQLKTVFEGPCLRVRRAASTDTANSHSMPIAAALQALVAPFAGATDIRVKFKVIRVDIRESLVVTTAYYEAAGRFAQGTIQQRATWHCAWSRDANNRLLLQSIRTTDFEEAANSQQRDKWFVDCTESVLGKNRSYQEHLRFGVDHWRERIDSLTGLTLAAFHGIAVGDINGDGFDDIYVCQGGGLPNRLFLQQADGSARDVSAVANVDFLEKTASALFVDLDNDGDQDLVVAASWGLVMLSNDGHGVFQPEDRMPLGAEPYVLSAIDYDNDRDLDIYVGCYQQGAWARGIPMPIPYHDAKNGDRNFLIANEGNWRFTNVAGEVGLNINNNRFTLACSWEDYDNDGDMDLYVANDFGRNNLYRNDNGQFVDAAAEAGVEDIAAGMSASWGDYNNDGLMDIYVSNMFSSAGNRITYQRQFQSSIDAETKDSFRRMARGNTLFQNAGDGTFHDVSVAAGVTMGRWAWGSVLADLNNDGWQDVYVANGYITQDDADDL